MKRPNLFVHSMISLGVLILAVVSLRTGSWVWPGLAATVNLLLFVADRSGWPVTVAKGPGPRTIRGYQRRDTGAGRWLDPPVAVLDKSTLGKLLTSRAGREPRLRVVLGDRQGLADPHVLYDAELDG